MSQSLWHNWHHWEPMHNMADLQTVMHPDKQCTPAAAAADPLYRWRHYGPWRHRSHQTTSGHWTRPQTVTEWNHWWKREENKKHLKNVGPIRHCESPHPHSPGVASGTVGRRLRIDVHDDDNENAWQRGPLWPHGMGPITVNLCKLGLEWGTISRTIPDLW